MSFPGAQLYRHVLFPIFITFLLCQISFSMPGNITDQHALLSFKAGLILDPLQPPSSWNESTHFCEWAGITCGRRHRRVTKIDLSSSKLVGSLSPAIGNLSFLREILLSNNGFTGKIPNEIGRLTRLQKLKLANNSLSSEIPKNISRCASLEVINLGGNNLTGELPMEFQSLSKLQLMIAYRNKLTQGIPPQYGNISSLLLISIGGNNLQGMIPNSLGRLKKLTIISLGDNKLSGNIPHSFSNLSLEVIDLIDNQLEGYLPLNLSDTLLSRLRVFSVESNRFIGHIPLWVSNAPRIQVFQLGSNNFTGEVPNFGGLKHLRFLLLEGNEYLGSGKSRDLRFMESLTNCTDLEVLELSHCNFGGEFPPYIGNFSSNLKSFGIVDNNYIIGKIPIEIGQLIKMETLGLRGNLLSGTIPQTIGKLQNIYELQLGGNKLFGEIPSSLVNLTKLSILSLASNNLEGVIPSGLAKCRFLNVVELYANNLSGCIPKEILLLGLGIVYLDISYNNLTCSLPLEIGGLKSLTHLNLSNNHFYGEIPPTFSSLVSVVSLDVSSNHLMGKFPSFLANLSSLKYLNLSHNDLEGEVPLQGIFMGKNGLFLEGNNKLCGGVPELCLPKCTNNKTTQRSRLSLGLKIVISILCGTFALALMVVILVCYYMHIRRKENTSLENPTTMEVIPMLSYKSLHEATNGFSQENLIGSGKFSLVYKGNFDEQGKVLAIKVLMLHVKGASKSFIAECDALRHTRHRNLVKVVSCCSGIDFQGNDFKAIIYEYMEMGNLETWLHHLPKENDDDHNEERTSLSFLERMNIGKDIACALDYLHAECGTPLVHCDLKPSNVLLDCDLVAHVSDFGLAKFLPDVAHASSTGIKGTFGYAAPEYGTGSEFSTFGDMYSFGILLLEMFTGSSPTCDMFINGLNLHKYVKIAIPHRVMEIADPTLLYKDEDDTSSKSSQISRDRILELLTSVFEIGIACSVDSPSERMDACTAMNKLRSIKTGLLEARRK